MEEAATSVTKLVRSHRSIRQFTAEQVDLNMVDRLLVDALAGSSSSGNLNQVSVIRTHDPLRKAKLCTMHLNQPMVLQAPLVLTFCGDVFRTRQWLSQRKVRNNFDNLLGYHTAAFDAVIMAQTTALLMESTGLGICFMGTTLHNATEIAAFLELPKYCMPVLSMVVGWPAEQPARRERVPGNAWIHDERYVQPTTGALDSCYARYEREEWFRYTSLGEHITAKMSAMGITSLASYITSDIGYPPNVFARDSARLLKLLAAQGFLPDADKN